MVRTKQIRVRIPKEIADLYAETLKTNNIQMKDDIYRHISEVIRTKGVTARELYGIELQKQAEQILSQVRIDRLNMQEAFTDAMLADVELALAPKTKDGRRYIHSYESTTFFINDIAERHHVPKISVLACMRQRVYGLYADNPGELENILKTLEMIQDDIPTTEVKT